MVGAGGEGGRRRKSRLRGVPYLRAVTIYPSHDRKEAANTPLVQAIGQPPLHVRLDLEGGIAGKRTTALVHLFAS